MNTKQYHYEREINRNNIDNSAEEYCIEKMTDKIEELTEANEITLKAYENLYNAVDKMFYDICNQWENGMDIEEFVRSLRCLMYPE